MCIEIWSLIVDFLTFIALIISVIFLYRQISNEYNWNRRKAAQDIIFQISQGDLLELRKKLNEYANDFYNDETYETAVLETKTKEEKTELNHTVRTYLSYLEGIALGIKQNLYEDKILYDYLGSALPEICRWAMPFIKDRRIKTKDEDIYIGLTRVAEKWKKRELKKCGIFKRYIQRVKRIFM